ncbi:aminoglycoside adenylyltransferase family protein [Streptomyces sp. NPDC058373]|uniref:aminoglycoside adenylyltransferase family protein n=1 Tax=Streptomyces sp. NPDC058373 TaxID=3346465 RepID=UPI003656641A
MTQVDEVAALVRELVAGGDLVGMYLYGSATVGGLRPYSDLDVFVVVRRGLADGQRRGLTDGLRGISGAPGRPVELTAVVLGEVVPWRYPPRQEYQYGEWLRDAYERGEVPAQRTDPDLAPLISMVVADGRALAGPSPGEVLPQVPPADLARAVTAGVPELLAGLADDTRNVLLTLARVWVTLATGAIVPKDAAAEWALARMPEEHRGALAHAREVYLGEAEESWGRVGPGHVADCAAYLAGQARGLAAG